MKDTASERPTTGETNTTGIQCNPDEARATVKGALEGSPDRDGFTGALGRVRGTYMRLGMRIGSLPEPRTPSARVKAKVQAEPALHVTLLDKLGERLAFERNGVRLYDALLSHVEDQGSWRGGPRAADVTHFRDEELEHFRIVRDAVGELGGDPTAITPCGNVTMVVGSGIGKVLADPRTTVLQCVDALLVAELTDNDSWDLLIQLTQTVGADAMVKRFEACRDREREHLEHVRAWVREGMTATPMPPFKSRSRSRAKATAG